MIRSLPRLSSLAGCIALLLLCGCTRKWDEGGTTHYAFELWVGAVLMIATVAALPAGLLLRMSSERWGYGLLFLGAIGLLISPGMFLDHVTLNDESFTLRTGFWFWPTKHDVKFSDVSSIAVTSKTSRKRRGGKSTSTYLECQKTSGPMETVPVGTLMKGAYRDILAKAGGRGIPIQDLRDVRPEDAGADVSGFEGAPAPAQE